MLAFSHAPFEHFNWRVGVCPHWAMCNVLPAARTKFDLTKLLGRRL
jgi:hypothetical protein